MLENQLGIMPRGDLIKGSRNNNKISMLHYCLRKKHMTVLWRDSSCFLKIMESWIVILVLGKHRMSIGLACIWIQQQALSLSGLIMDELLEHMQAYFSCYIYSFDYCSQSQVNSESKYEEFFQSLRGCLSFNCSEISSLNNGVVESDGQETMNFVPL